MTTPPVEIRDARPDESPALAHLMVDTWLRAHRGQMPDHLWQKRVTEWTYEVSGAGWTRELTAIDEGTAPGEAILVANDNGLVGLAATRLDPAPATVEVGSLYVAFDRQQQGIGRALIEAIASRYVALGATQMHIGVLKTNEPARRFYERIGGTLVTERSFDEEGTPLPEIVYGWQLPLH